eukprot:6141849-Pleurochrysis_carterae.AAC.1
MEADHVLLAAKYVWHAHVVYVVADDVASCCCRGHVCVGMNGVAAVGAEALFTGDAAYKCRPCIGRVSCALRQKFDYFRAAMVEACVQQLRRHCSSV